MLGLGINTTASSFQLLGQLKSAGIISEMVMGVYLNTYYDPNSSYAEEYGFGDPFSNVILGGYDLYYAEDPSQLVYIDMIPGTTSGEVLATGISFDNFTIEQTYPAIIDPGSQYTVVDYETFDQIGRVLGTGCIEVVYGNYKMYQCYRTQDIFSLQLGMHIGNDGNFTLIGNKFRYLNVRNNYENYAFTIIGADVDRWVIGVNFMRTYYTIYDLEKSRFGITPSIPNAFNLARLLGPFLIAILGLSFA